MKWSIFKCILIGWILFSSTDTWAERSSKELSDLRRSKWDKLIPDYHKLQYAGSMGFLSLGTGWTYGKHNNWETEFLIGVVPRYRTEDISITATLKENYIPFHLDLDQKKPGKWVFAPLTASIYFNKIFGEHFWTELPERYPEKYYVLATNLRFNVSLGQSITYGLRANKYAGKSISFFYEVGTNDCYIIEAIQDKSIRMKDILSLSLGIKIDMY